MPLVVRSGIKLTVIGSEVVFHEEAANRNYILATNLSGMRVSDGLQIRLYTVLFSGQTYQLSQQITITGLQAVPIRYTDPISSPHAISARVRQYTGSPRNVKFELIAI